MLQCYLSAGLYPESISTGHRFMSFDQLVRTSNYSLRLHHNDLTINLGSVLNFAIAPAAYEKDWFTYDFAVQKDILLLILRTQKPCSVFIMSINITIGSYGVLSEILEFSWSFSYKVLGLVVLTIYCASLLFIICDCTQSATAVMAEGVQSALLSLHLLQVEVETQKEIDHFISAIELNGWEEFIMIYNF
ncbi:hypothetical protein GQX74_014629 [Glossina fuscipes]|nr:hypothetical protein GQX74_014629 [Glossina fuscipes]